MSGPGQSRPTRSKSHDRACPLRLSKRTICTPSRQVRLVNNGPEQMQHDPRLLDHLIGAHEQRWWHCEAKRLRSFEVDHQLESRGLFDWHINWVCAPQNLVHD